MAKRYKKEKINKIIGNIILITIFVLLIKLILDIYSESKIEARMQNLKQSTLIQKQVADVLIKGNMITADEIKGYEAKEKLVEVPKEYKGYSVIARLQIPKIKMDTCVLAEFSENGLNVCASKFWGPNPNEVGNFCIAGHNSRTKKMFTNIKNLEIDDEIYLTDEKNGTYEYKVYDIYRVKPENTSCLSQETNNKREITLITCTNSAKERIIVKAKCN